jgi:hypothetical protein
MCNPVEVYGPSGRTHVLHLVLLTSFFLYKGLKYWWAFSVYVGKYLWWEAELYEARSSSKYLTIQFLPHRKHASSLLQMALSEKQSQFIVRIVRVQVQVPLTLKKVVYIVTA